MLECLRRPPEGSQIHLKGDAEGSWDPSPYGFSACPLNTTKLPLNLKNLEQIGKLSVFHNPMR